MQVRYLRHKEIDYVKWDQCIKGAANSFVYALTWYLDIVSPGWEALVAGDYEYVMPLPRKCKCGFAYLVQPPLTQQLGIFSQHEIGENIAEVFIRKIPYLSYHLNLNEGNASLRAVQLPNYVLNLNRTYEELYAGFSKNTKRNIHKAQIAGVSVREGLTPQEFLKFYCGVEKKYVVPHTDVVIKLLDAGFARSELLLLGAYDVQEQPIAALCLLVSNKRLVYLLPVSNEEGKRTSAMFMIIDHIVRSCSHSERVLDFEGSRVEGIARFYQGFGGIMKPYGELKKRSVNDWISKLKRVWSKENK